MQDLHLYEYDTCFAQDTSSLAPPSPTRLPLWFWFKSRILWKNRTMTLPMLVMQICRDEVVAVVCIVRNRMKLLGFPYVLVQTRWKSCAHCTPGTNKWLCKIAARTQILLVRVFLNSLNCIERSMGATISTRFSHSISSSSPSPSLRSCLYALQISMSGRSTRSDL